MTQIVSINGRQWVLGMDWRSFDAAPALDELKLDAEDFNADWYALRLKDESIQAGYCKPLDNLLYPKKLFSLGALLADSEEQPWLGIFKIADNLWWYIAVRDGHAILPDGDVVGTEDDVYKARENHSGLAGWNFVEGNIEELAQLIKTIEKKPIKLKSFTYNGFSFKKKLLLLVGVIGIVVSGIVGWQYQQQANLEARQVAMEKMRVEIAKNAAGLQPNLALLNMASPNVWLRSCSNIIDVIPLSKDGWVLKDLMCANHSVTVHWNRAEGATVGGRPDGVVSADGESVDQTIQTQLEEHSVDERINLPEASLALRAWSQKLKATLLFSSFAPIESKTLPGTTADKVNRAPSIEVPMQSFKMSLLVSPFSLNWNDLQGLRLKSLQSTEAGWEVEGVVYGK